METNQDEPTPIIISEEELNKLIAEHGIEKALDLIGVRDLSDDE